MYCHSIILNYKRNNYNFCKSREKIKRIMTNCECEDERNKMKREEKILVITKIP